MYAVDRKTSLHDGVESYVKLGRLCVIKEERGKSLADLLINAALDWAKENAAELENGAGERFRGGRASFVCMLRNMPWVFGRGMGL